jgi:hypothetical protein
MPQQLRITLDPAVSERHGPEIAWIWRTLLSGMGYAWAEEPLDGQPVDIAYVRDPAQAPPARLVIRADPQRWANPLAYRLEAIGHGEGWAFPRFAGDPAGSLVQHGDTEHAVIERDVIFDVYWLLTGREERQAPKRKHGYTDLTGTATLATGALRQALASSIAAGLERQLVAFGARDRAPRWPFGKRMAAGIGHDVDYPEVIRWLEPARILARRKLVGLPAAVDVVLGRRHHWHFASWMELERRLGTRSAFYFVARKGSLREYATGLPDTFYDIRAPQFRALFRELADAGWEIGLHASYLAHANVERFAAERAALAAASRTPVLGNRHHYWHMDEQNPEATLLMHEQIGLHYDTSLVHDRYLGWRRGTNWPFFPFHHGERRALRTLQLPTCWMDDQIFGQRAYNPGDPAALLSGLADTTAAHGGCMIIDIHDYVYDDVLFPGWTAAFQRLWEHLAQRNDVWMATPGEIAAHWRERAEALSRASAGLTGTPSQAVTLS